MSGLRRHPSRLSAPLTERKVPALAFLAWALAAAGCEAPRPAVQVLDLSQGWEFRLASSPAEDEVPAQAADRLGDWLPATVPGTVHTDLLANGIIQDPYWRDGELLLQWIGDQDWIYRTTFAAPAALVEKDRLELVFHGLDTFAEVRLNGEVILEADNMFRVWRVDVTGRVQPGENTLAVLFHSPLPIALQARSKLPYELPAGNDRGDPPSRVFVRKAAYHYGWDWGPRFVTSGIWQPVELVGWSGARLGDLHLILDTVSAAEARLAAEVEVEVTPSEASLTPAGGKIPGTLVLTSPEGAFPEVRTEVELLADTNRITVPLVVPQPRLWWPNGLGEPHLYTVEARLAVGRRTDRRSARFGIRTVELVREPDSIGESFYFRVNGVPVFMKGANVIPLDHFTPRVVEEDYRRLFEDVTAANMNMLRVWGGGIYPPDVFYRLADESGVLVWQDFMFANGMYPGDSAFLASVRAEAADQVRRLRSHPSLALWCGNNEIDEGWRYWGWARRYESPADSAAVRGAYEAIFEEILPRTVATLDPGRPYWPSSPSRGWGDPASLTEGDSHYWGVWHGREPFEVYVEKLPRFASEYGFQAFPPMATIREFTEEADRSLFNPVLLVHQKHPIGNELIATYMEREYPVPSSFEDFVYVSQLLQARGMRVAFEAHRRARPRTMGTLYWQLNDTWPVVSWSSLDGYGRWKALHYAARGAFAPVLLSPVLRGDTVEIWGVSDRLTPTEGQLRLELLDFGGTLLWQAPIPVSLAPNASSVLWRGSMEELLGEADPTSVVLAAQMEGEGEDTEALLYFRTPKELALATPRLDLQVAPEGEEASLTITSNVLAKDVQLTLEGAHFSDNFFDLLPGRPRTVRVSPERVRGRAPAPLPEPDRLLEKLHIRTLADVPREGVPAATESPRGE